MLDPISAALSKACPGPVFTHSDLRGLLTQLGPDVRTVIRELGEGDGLMRRLTERLRTVVGDRELWVPTYNYDFCKTGFFSVDDDPAQIGALPEYYRKSEADWRTDTPVFSVCGSGSRPASIPGEIIDPFGVHSEFHQLCERDGSLLFFGVLFSPTMTHYVERVATAEGPLYRYDKLFHGRVRDSLREYDVTMKYHVIPQGVTLKYDMVRLQRELLEASIMRPLQPEFGVSFVVSARELIKAWGEGLVADPYYLLDDASRRVAEELVSVHGGHRLQISEFDDEDFGVARCFRQ